VNKVLNLAVVVFVMFMVGCAGLQTKAKSNYINEHVYIADEEIAHEEIADEECTTRLNAAVKSSTVLFKAIPDIQKETIEDCGRGILAACISAPFAIPYTGLIAVLYAPVGFLIGLTFEDAQTVFCGHDRRARMARPQNQG
jgi:hypothetical protein